MVTCLNPNTVYDRVAKSWLPPEKLSLADWAEQNLFLSGSQPGLWRRDFAPYQAGILDALSDPSIEKVTIIAGSQTGKTTISQIVIGYFIDHDPSTIIYIRESKDKAQEFANREMMALQRIPRLKELLSSERDRSRKKGQARTKLKKYFPGGYLILTGSESAASLAGLDCRVVICDEISKFKPIPAFGNVINLAESRTNSYTDIGTRKMVFISVPGEVGAGNEARSGSIEELYQQGDQREFEVPCPYCGCLQSLKFANVIFAHCRQKLDSIFYRCEHCKEQINQAQLREAVRKGQWVAHHEVSAENVGHASFKVSGLISPFLNMREIVKRFLQTRDMTNALRPFLNDTLGDSWEDREEEVVSTNHLMERRESFHGMVPLQCGVITAGVDTQDDRLELSIVGWDRGRQSYVLDHKVLYGSPAEPEVWEALYSEIDKQYAHESGGEIGLSCVFMDSGGHHSDAVMRFAKPHWPKVVAIRGSNQAGSPLLPTRYKKKGIYKVFDLGVTAAKDTLYGRLRITPGEPGSVHFSSHLEEEYFRQLMAEKRVPKVVGGQIVTSYKSLRARNEALDCFVYAYCAFEYWEKSRRKLESMCDYYASLVVDSDEESNEEEETPVVEEVKPSVQMDVKPIEPIKEPSKEVVKPIQRRMKYGVVSSWGGW